MSRKSRRRSAKGSRTGKGGKDLSLPSDVFDVRGNRLPAGERNTHLGLEPVDVDVDVDDETTDALAAPPVSAPVMRQRRRSAARTTSPQTAEPRRTAPQMSPGPMPSVPRKADKNRGGQTDDEGDVPAFMKGGAASPVLSARDAAPARRQSPPPKRRRSSQAPIRRRSSTRHRIKAKQAFDPAATNAVPPRRKSAEAPLPDDLVVGDFRKPQLSATIHGPLSDRDRRRASAEVQRAIPDVTEQVEHAEETEVVAGAPRAVQQLHTGTHETPSAEAAARERPEYVEWIDYRIPTVGGLLLAIGALVLPATAGSELALWEAITSKVEVLWPLGLRISVLAMALAVAVMGIAWTRGDLYPDIDDEVPSSGWLMLAVLLGVIGIAGRQFSDPNLVIAAMEPMRGGLFGIPFIVFGAITAGGLVQLADARRARSARILTGLGASGLLAGFWMPIGWLGESILPVFAAASANSGVNDLGANQVTGTWMAGPAVVYAQALLGPAVLTLLALRERVPRQLLWVVAGLVIVIPGLDPLVTAPDNAGLAGLGVLAGNLGLAILIATATALALDRLFAELAIDTRNEAETVAVVIVIGVWLLAKTNGLRLSATDEGIYYYAAKAWAEGLWPYHDFFFSHPPLHIAIPALVYSVFGFSVLAGKWISVLAALVTAIVVWRMGRDYLDPLAGIIAMVLFLFASEALKASTNLTGINLTTMWCMLGTWALLSRRGFLGGMLLGIAACTGVYAAGFFLALAVLGLFAHRPAGGSPGLMGRVFGSPFTQLVLGFAIAFGTINLLFHTLGGDAFLDGVYRYHFLKRAKTPGFRPMSEGLGAMFSNLELMLSGRDFAVSLYYHGVQYWFALLAPLGVAMGIAARRAADGPAPVDLPSKRHRSKRISGGHLSVIDHSSWALLWDPRMWWLHRHRDGFIMLMYGVAWALLAEFAQFKERYDFYYMLLLPVVSLLAASWVSSVMRIGRIAIGAGWGWLQPGTAERFFKAAASPAWVKGAAAAAVFISFLWVPVTMFGNQRAWPSEYSRKNAAGESVSTVGEKLTFAWIDTPGPAALSDATKALLWKPYRLRGNMEFGLHHYLWSKKRYFSTAQEIADYIHDNSELGDTIIGSSTHAPVIALLAKRRLAADHVDTNTKVFKTGIVSREDYWTRVCADNVKYIVAGPMSFFSPRVMHRKPSVVRNFKLVQQWEDPHLKHWRTVKLQLWKRKGPSCRYYKSFNDAGHAPAVRKKNAAVPVKKKRRARERKGKRK